MKFGGLFQGFSFGAGFELMRHVVVPAILVATPLMLWWWLGPEKPSCDSARQLAARSAIAQAAEMGVRNAPTLVANGQLIVNVSNIKRCAEGMAQ